MDNKKILFACLHRPERSPSQRFRFEQYLGILASAGYHCEHSHLLNEKDDKIYYAEGKLIQKLIILIKCLIKRINESYFKQYDIVFVQRECFMLGTSFFERRFAKRSKLIFDFDDSIWMHQTGEIKSKNKLLYFLKDPLKTERIIKASHMVFAGNDFLATYAKQFNDLVEIVPTTIDTEEYLIKDTSLKKDRICIGWSGSFSTIIHFQFVIEALKEVKLLFKDQVYFKVIGDGSYINEALEIQGIPWAKKTELEDLSEIDVGLMPLPNDKWTEGKCGLKGLQYMALGIPTIMSSVGVNSKIIDNGINGLLADSIEDWVEKISFLINNPEKRTSLGINGRDTVSAFYSVKSNENKYLKSFKEILVEN